MTALLRKRYPSADRPIIDFDVASLMEPMTLWGATAGAILNSILPSWLVDILIIATVSYTATKTFQKGIALLKKERQSLKASPTGGNDGVVVLRHLKENSDETHVKESAAVVGNDNEDSLKRTRRLSIEQHAPGNKSINSTKGEYASLMTSPSSSALLSENSINSSSSSPPPSLSSLELTAILEREKKTPLTKIAVLSAISLAYMVCALLAGGHGAPSVVGVPTCSILYWLIIAIPLPVLYIVSLIIGRRIQALYEKKVALGYTFLREDPRFTERQIRLYPVYSISAGVVAGLLGLGGGLIKSPLMLQLGMNPLVVTSTSSYMILFTSFTSSFAFAMIGALSLPYAIWYALIGLCGAIVGQAVVDFIVKKYKMQSFVILLLGTVMAFGGLLLVISSTYTVFKDVQQHEHLGLSFEMCAR
eukprot:CAMPEP_0184647208 /NCGR_PEP_ID=MMETSP0308-20130426/4109_1 /TAXON_ID=38269 /ORGANISM="Gloeochaete witrockiana, Strain SAG 46.84" /LENGTH=418 /DNA_ID=CAMNT_0027077999 /DNA_START=301 /DNA_END=1557 /DNA_ORIENTATION=-